MTVAIVVTHGTDEAHDAYVPNGAHGTNEAARAVVARGFGSGYCHR
jgi:hypothetical protein